VNNGECRDLPKLGIMITQGNLYIYISTVESHTSGQRETRETRETRAATRTATRSPRSPRRGSPGTLAKDERNPSKVVRHTVVLPVQKRGVTMVFAWFCRNVRALPWFTHEKWENPRELETHGHKLGEHHEKLGHQMGINLGSLFWCVIKQVVQKHVEFVHWYISLYYLGCSSK